MLNSAEEVADELGNFFESTYIKEPPGDIPVLDKRTDRIVPDLELQTHEVKILLEQLNVTKSFGPDNIHPKLLKSLCKIPSFVNSLTQLFQKCYDDGSLPNVWKTTHITALHKKGGKSLASIYSPISLTSVLAKTFEKLIRNHLLEYVQPYITNQQHGFLPGKSCVSNLLECMDLIYEILSNEDTADILYLDFQKAFDTVSHQRLISKLRAYGIEGKTLNIINDFLSGRTFKVKVGPTLSKSF